MGTEQMTAAEIAERAVVIRAGERVEVEGCPYGSFGVFVTDYGIQVNVPTETHKEACALIQNEVREKIRGHLERAASDERRRVADLLGWASRLLRRVYLNGQTPSLSRQTALRLVKEVEGLLADPNAQRALPEPAAWVDERERLEDSLKVAADFIRQHCHAGRKGVPGGRAAEIVDGIDQLLDRPRDKGHMDTAWADSEDLL